MLTWLTRRVTLVWDQWRLRRLCRSDCHQCHVAPFQEYEEHFTGKVRSIANIDDVTTADQP